MKPKSNSWIYSRAEATAIYMFNPLNNYVINAVRGAYASEGAHLGVRIIDTNRQ